MKNNKDGSDAVCLCSPYSAVVTLFVLISRFSEGLATKVTPDMHRDRLRKIKPGTITASR